MSEGIKRFSIQGRIKGEGAGGAHPHPAEITCDLLIQLMFKSRHQSVTPFLSGAPPPKTNPGSAPGINFGLWLVLRNTMHVIVRIKCSYASYSAL